MTISLDETAAGLWLEGRSFIGEKHTACLFYMNLTQLLAMDILFCCAKKCTLGLAVVGEEQR